MRVTFPNQSPVGAILNPLVYLAVMSHPAPKGPPELTWPPAVERLIAALHAAEAVLLRARVDHDQVGVARAHRRRAEILRRLEATKLEAHDRDPAPVA
jgi:hypothetical protein